MKFWYATGCMLSMQLYNDIVPKTCENFRALCTGERGESPDSEFKLHYEASLIHRIVPNGWIQGGGKCQRASGCQCLFVDKWQS